VLLVLAVAGLARRAVAAADPGSASRARVLVTAEAVLGLAVLGVTSFLVATPPSRVTFGPPYSASLTAKDVEGRTLRVDVDVLSTRTGSQTMRLRVVTPDGAPAVFDSATAELRGPGDAPPLEVEFAGGPDSGGPESGAGSARVDVPVAGRWSMTVHIVIGAVSDYAATTTYTVR
jgi:copper transport protein